MIEVENIDFSYGRLRVLRCVSLNVGESELAAIVGPNGAGKSTLMRCIMGLNPASGGTVRFCGEDITAARPEKIVKLGLTLVPESKELFPHLSVLDNLLLGAYVHRHERNARVRRMDTLESTFDVFPVLRERQQQRAASLSGGQQQMVAIGRALMTRPRALLLDEPSLGIAPLVIRDIFSAIARLRASGLGILLVEQNVRAALKLAERAYILENGMVIASGGASEIASNDRVTKAYFGSVSERPSPPDEFRNVS